MDSHKIGTDASLATHIKNLIERGLIKIENK